MKARLVAAIGAAASALVVGVCAVSCSSQGGADGVSPAAPSSATPGAPTRPNYVAGPADSSGSVVLRGARVGVARAYASPPLRDLPDAVPVEDRFDHEPGPNPFKFARHAEPDAVLQSALPIVQMPVALESFLGQGSTLGDCVFPSADGGEPPSCTTNGDPPDTVGAVGPSDYVQVVNGGVGVWKKNGTIAASPKFTSSLFATLPTTDGNACGAAPSSPKGGDWGDGVVLYDSMADRWLITQFDLTNYVNSGTGPSYQCVAVSQTGDPTGAYWLYDFEYSAYINDYGKFSVWPDAYYASFNDFDATFTGADLCAYDRAAMLTGATATQQCFTSTAFGFLPASVDGAIPPPVGEPGFFVSLDPSGTAIDLYKLHVDWTTPASSTFTGPTSLAVAAFDELCGGSDCVAQPSPGNALASLGDRPMFHLGYRNFGTLESLTFNHAVTAGSTGGIRWYEIRSPNGTPVVFQQGTYAPSDSNYRWMGSLAQDQAQDIALGFSISSATTAPSIAWTGRLATDTGGTMGQAETVILSGVGVETGDFSDGTEAQRWGDYSNMAVDPSDDCTFWYTQEAFPANGAFNWDTRISSVKFPSCAQNDFSISLAPASQSVGVGGHTTYTVTTASTKGTAESIALTAEDLPAGVTAGFAPASVTAGTSSTLTLTAPTGTALTSSADTFMVIGKATSAVHRATAEVSVVACVKLTSCPSPDDCGSISDGCGGNVPCGTCAALDACHVAGTCTTNVCSNPPAVNGTPCAGGTCQGGTCVATLPDAGPLKDSGTNDASTEADSGALADSGTTGTGEDSGSSGASEDSGSASEDSGTPAPGDAATVPVDSGAGAPGDAATSDGGATGGGGQSSGCSCRTARPVGTSPGGLLAMAAPFGLAVLRRRRRRSRA